MAFLSTEIFNLFENLNSEKFESSSLPYSGLSEWSTQICSILQQHATVQVDDCNSYEYYASACLAVAPQFQWLECYFSNSSIDVLLNEVLLGCQWIRNDRELFLIAATELHNAINQKENVDSGSIVALSLLLISQILEISLRRLLRATNSNRTCPSMLKDILTHPALEQAIGTDLVRLLNLLVGPPVSLNLRNLAWHGFLLSVPSNVISSVCALCTSLTLIGRYLRSSNAPLFDALCQSELFNHIKANVRPLERLLTLVRFSNSEEQSYFEEFIFGKNLSLLVDCLGAFIFKRIQVKNILELICYLYCQGRYYELSCLAIVIIEAVLRIIFCSVNNLPQRELCALNSTHFTTLDVMLRSSSNLASVLPNGLLVWLLDVTQLDRGPRFRDHLSHGEFFNELVGHNWATGLQACLLSVLLFSIPSMPISAFTIEADRKCLLKLAEFWFNEGCASVCHPAYCLANLMLSTKCALLQLNKIIIEISQCSLNDDNEKIIPESFEDPETSVDSSEFVVKCNLISIWELSNQPLSTTWLVYLEGLVLAAKQSLEAMNQFALARLQDLRSNRQLRSRQRANLASFVVTATANASPFCTRLLNLSFSRLCSIVDCLNFPNVDANNKLLSTMQSPANNKKLKRLRKILDNWRSHSAPDKNRWLECSQLMSQPQAEEDMNELWKPEFNS